jgi:hypothetical protein
MRSLFYIMLFVLSCVVPTERSPTSNENYKVVVENHYVDKVSFFNNAIEKRADWKEPPNIIICRNTKISKQRIKSVLNFWERLGYSFGEIFEFSCIFDIQYHGAIYIMEPNVGFDFNLVANTHTSYAVFQDKRKEIIGAWIEIPNTSITTARVLEHEFGHALGFQHTTERNHIMNKELNKGGISTTGLNSRLH